VERDELYFAVCWNVQIFLKFSELVKDKDLGERERESGRSKGIVVAGTNVELFN
jgi:hypothetical protein